MEYIIGGILVIIVLIIVALIFRKRLYDQVDYYEGWKLDIMNRNVATELAKVKELNLEGDTKDKFELWKESWENILNSKLADVEEHLYDTEAAADRYKFGAAKSNMKKMEAILVECEKVIETILTELNELLATEEENRKEIEKLAPQLTDMRKQLSQNRFKYDRAELRFELEVDELQHELVVYEELVDEGNYLQAKEVVDLVKERIVSLQEELDEFPTLYDQCKNELPSQLDELSKGVTEMKEEGYYIEHLNLEKQINDYQASLVDTVQSLEKIGTDDAKEVIPKVEEAMKEMYEQLENEALAKNYVDSKVQSYDKALESFTTSFTGTQTEVEELKQAYYFEDDDLEKYRTLEKKLNQLKDQLKIFTEKVELNNTAHSTLREELESGFAQLEAIEEEHELFKERIHTLRKDELEAREQFQTMNDDIYKLNRKLRQSNLPGVPNHIWDLIHEASKKNEHVLETLEIKPIDIAAVQKSISEAENAVKNAIDNTEEMMEHAFLTEQVIQYANRYRSSNAMLAAQLIESENLFRKAQYELALEKAARAIEEVEPGALKKIEKNQEMIVS